MDIFKKVDTKMIVTAPIVEAYLPFEYAEKDLYYMKGERVEFFGVCNIKYFQSEDELENRVSAPTIPIGISMMMISDPTDIEIMEVQFYPNGPFRKCIVLRYYQDDEFMCNTLLIKSANNVSSIMNMLENGKLTFIPIKHVTEVIQDAQDMNGINLKLPMESLEAMILDRYRDPNNRSKKYRFAKNKDSDNITSVTPREDTMTSTTYQAVTFEDINTSLISSVNRARAGIVDEPTTMETLIRGGSIEDKS